MIKKLGMLVVVLMIAAGLMAGLAPGLTLAAEDINVVSSTATPQFPSSLAFSVQATSGANIVDVRLHFTVERDSFVKVVTEEKLGFSSSTSITAVYNWDMRQSGGLPGGTVVDFWWTLKDSAGKSVTTSPQEVSFDDTHFTWRSLKESNITIYWYSGNNSLAQTLMDTAQSGLSNLEKNTGARLSRPVSIYIYDNTTDMKGAMIFAQEWTGGATYPPYSTIVIGINTSNLDWGKGALVHELAHMVNYQMTNNPYSGLPTWLDEGLAMYSQGALDSTFEVSLIGAMAQGSLFTVRSMASPFSTDAALSYQEYAQSYSLIDFLVSRYGQSKMAALLETFRQGNTYDGALMQVYGFDMDGLYNLWLPFAIQKYLSAKTGAAA
ncbi:MAG: peptidase MA domain-containing protein [Dehalococcoidia bacterium]|nr:MAG: peptidase MA domain-containing protein [Dehalococcoidia bacterium]